jgi:hypothetical protein
MIVNQYFPLVFKSKASGSWLIVEEGQSRGKFRVRSGLRLRQQHNLKTTLEATLINV